MSNFDIVSINYQPHAETFGIKNCEVLINGQSILDQILDSVVNIATHMTFHGYFVIATGNVVVYKTFQTSIVFLSQCLVSDDNGKK